MDRWGGILRWSVRSLTSEMQTHVCPGLAGDCIAQMDPVWVEEAKQSQDQKVGEMMRRTTQSGGNYAEILFSG